MTFLSYDTCQETLEESFVRARSDVNSLTESVHQSVSAQDRSSLQRREPGEFLHDADTVLEPPVLVYLKTFQYFHLNKAKKY